MKGLGEAVGYRIRIRVAVVWLALSSGVHLIVLISM